MLDENSLSYLPLYDPRHSQAYINAMNAMSRTDGDCYNMQYHHSIIDDNNVNDSIKVRVLYNELMQLKTQLLNSKAMLWDEINLLRADNKKLEDEIASIKQALYFG